MTSDNKVRVLDQLMEIALLIQDDMDRSLRELGLNPARTHVLWELHRQGPSTQQTLARALHVTPANITGLVDALVASEFAERRPHPSDRRATLVTLTSHGTATMEKMTRDRETMAARLIADFDDDGAARLGADLDTVAHRLRAILGQDLSALVTEVFHHVERVGSRLVTHFVQFG